MKKSGVAVQTFAGLLKVSKYSTFCPIEDISGVAGVPLRTAKRHLETLCQDGWLFNSGRVKRRTCTWVINPASRLSLKKFGALPINFASEGTWCFRAVLSVYFAQLMKLNKVLLNDPSVFVEDGFQDALESIGGRERLLLTLDQLQEATGLSRPSVVAGRKQVESLGIFSEDFDLWNQLASSMPIDDAA